MGQMQNDITLIRQYLNIHTTGKLTPAIIDPTNLKQEPFKIQKQLPIQLTLPVNPTVDIWYYYRFLTVTPINHGNKLVLMIRIPLIDLDSSMTLYKIYNLPVFHHEIGKSLLYQLESNNLTVTKDNKYATMLSDTDFLQCTLAAGHLCTLNSALYHMESTNLCLTAIFLRDNTKINNQC